MIEETPPEEIKVQKKKPKRKPKKKESKHGKQDSKSPEGTTVWTGTGDQLLRETESVLQRSDGQGTSDSGITSENSNQETGEEISQETQSSNEEPELVASQEEVSKKEEVVPPKAIKKKRKVNQLTPAHFARYRGLPWPPKTK